MSVTRRGFLKKVLAAGGAGAVLATADRAGAIEEFHGYPERYGVLTDVSKCIGCRSCEAACNQQHDLPEPEVPFTDLDVLEKKRRTTSKAYTVVNRYETKTRELPAYRKIQCNHCNEPACISACFVKALYKTKEGPVLWNKDLCVGCRYCLVACPFYIPAYEYEKAFTPRVMKCTMCFKKITSGRGAPACAEACPTETMTFGKLTDLIHLARERIRREPDKYVDHIYGEMEVGGTSWIYISDVPFDEIDLPTDLGTTPYPQYTKSALTWIPPIIVTWPVILGGVYALCKRRDEVHAKEQADAVASAIEETREATEKKQEQLKAGEIRRLKTSLEKEKKAAVEEAVAEALKEKDGATDEPDEPAGEEG
jgi:Fe-S-cluster-containing dehydrogenase component